MQADTQRRTLLFAAAAIGLAGTGALVAGAAEPRVIKVVAKKFEFVPPEIRLRRGEAVVLQFTAPEVPMGVNMPDFSVRTDVVPGQVASLALTPGQVGTFTFVCDVFCGTGHEEMSGVVVVSE